MRPFLKGRVALVTGASHGLGAGTAKLLARAGAAVVATADDCDALAEVVESIKAEGAHAMAIPAVLASDADVASMVDEAVSAAERIDYLVNLDDTTATIGKNLWELSVEDWADVSATNTTSVLNLIRHLVPVMQAQHCGHLLFQSSSSTFRPWPETGGFAASKAAVNQMVQTLALELHDSGVTVNAFNPGPIDTAVFDDVSEALQRSGRALRPDGDTSVTAGRPPELVAQLLLWLCSPETTDLNGEFIQWNNPNTLEAMQQFLQAQQIGAVA